MIATLLFKQYRNMLKVVSLAGLTGLSLFVATNSLAEPAILAVGSAPVAVPKKPAATYTLNFVDAEIHAVINAVSKITGMNFIVDPRVKGKVTIISNKEMPGDEIYQVFLSVLKVHGFAAVPGADITKIVPEVNAKQDAIPVMVRRDQYSSDAPVTRVIEVRYVDAAQLVPILRPLVPQRGHLAAYPASNVLVISDSANNINRLERIIRRIDQPTSDEVEVIPLEHASATEVVRIMTQLERQDPKKKSKLSMVADGRTNSILLGGSKTSRIRLRALIGHLDTPMEIGGNIHVVYLRNAVAKDLVPVLNGVSKSVTKAKGGQKAGVAVNRNSNISIQADESTNSLVITAPADVFRSLRSVIQKLDIRRAQVLVESVIAEVSQTAARELGVQWAAGGRNPKNPVGVVNFSNGYSAANLLQDPPPVADGLTMGLGDLVGASRIAALIRALSKDASTNILSTPSLMTLDNKEAEIVVGQNVPFITGQYSGTGGGSNPTNPFTTIKRQDVGLTLKIKPQINEGDSIIMDLTQEVSSLSSSTRGSDLITNKRSIKTTVMVDDGDILVLGGLVEESLRETEQRVPLLGDIPILGWLFRYQTTDKVKTNLMVFVHPTIVKDKAMSRGLTSEKYNFMRAQQLAIRERGVQLMDDEESPLLEEVQDIIDLPPPYEEATQSENVFTLPEFDARDDDSAEAVPAPDGRVDFSSRVRKAVTKSKQKDKDIAAPPPSSEGEDVE